MSVDARKGGRVRGSGSRPCRSNSRSESRCRRCRSAPQRFVSGRIEPLASNRRFPGLWTRDRM